MQIDPIVAKSLWEFFKSLGPAGSIAAYLAYKDLYKPWQRERNSNGNGSSTTRTPRFDPAEFVREGDFSGFSQSVRGFMDMYARDKQEFKERYNQDQNRLEGWVDDLSQRILTIERRR